MDIMKIWGFQQKQTYIWCKNKKAPLKDLLKLVNKSLDAEDILTRQNIKSAIAHIGETCKDQLNQMLQFGMGRLFRQTHEIALIGINNNGIYSKLMNRSQRSVSFATNLKHSMKPDSLHQSLEIMFPDTRKLELWARRTRPGWDTIGNQCENTMGQDINKSLTDLICQ
jgi:N6-adenosine-specific RNA methylase IME4